MDNLSYKPIGVIHSCYKQKLATPRQSGLTPSSQAYIELSPWVQPEVSLQGLDSFSHIWVLFDFHLNEQKNFQAKATPPRLSGDRTGLFSTRSPHRPNPIGLSLLELKKIEGNKVFVSNIDMVDKTPVLDIKPYIVDYESRPQATRGWLPKEEFLEVQFSTPVDEPLKTLIIDTLKNNPGPLPKKSEYSVFIENYDVAFKFLDAQKIQVIQVKTVALGEK